MADNPARDPSYWLDAAVGLTGRQDTQELQTALLETLRAALGSPTLRPYLLMRGGRDGEFHDGNLENVQFIDQLDPEFGAPRPLEEDAGVSACVSTRLPVQIGGRVLFPLFGAHHVRAVLAIEGMREDAATLDSITKLLRVYSNQRLLVSRTEHDALSGLYNRQAFDDRLRRLILRDGRQRRTGDLLGHTGNCFALFDIDHFKQVNDRYGHLYGDEVITLVAGLMRQSFRQDDLLFRYGGEEFAAVLSGMDLANAERSLERFRRAVEAFAFPQIGHKTMSIGFTAILAGQSVDQLVSCADKALYYAKGNGRNRTCCYERLVAERLVEPVALAKGDIELF